MGSDKKPTVKLRSVTVPLLYSGEAMPLALPGSDLRPRRRHSKFMGYAGTNII